MSAYDDAGRLIHAATKQMREARREFDAAMDRGDLRTAQDRANEMATCANVLGKAAAALEAYFAELRGVRADAFTEDLLDIVRGNTERTPS